MSGEGILLNGKYELITTTIVHEEIGSYIGYGIRYGEHTVTDISLDRAKIERQSENRKFNWTHEFKWIISIAYDGYYRGFSCGRQ